MSWNGTSEPTSILAGASETSVSTSTSILYPSKASSWDESGIIIGASVGVLAVLVVVLSIICFVTKRRSRHRLSTPGKDVCSGDSTSTPDKIVPPVFVITDTRDGVYGILPENTMHFESEMSTYVSLCSSQPQRSTIQKMDLPSPLENGRDSTPKSRIPQKQAPHTADKTPYAVVCKKMATSRTQEQHPSREGRHYPPLSKSLESQKRDSGYLSVEDLVSQRSSLRIGSEDLEDIDEDMEWPRAGSNATQLKSHNPRFKLSGSSPNLDVCEEVGEAESMDKTRSMPSLIHKAHLHSIRGAEDTRQLSDSRGMMTYDFEGRCQELCSSEDTAFYSNNSLAYFSKNSSEGLQSLELHHEDPSAFGESCDFLSPPLANCTSRREGQRGAHSSQGSASSGLSSARQSSGSQTGSITSGPSFDASFSDLPSQEGDMSPVLVEGLVKPNLMGHDWQWCWTALPQGCTLQRENSHICLQVPPGAVDTSTEILGSVFTRFARVKEHIHIPSCQMIVSPVVELFTTTRSNFSTHVKLQLPHNLPHHFNQADLKVFCFQNDIEARLFPVPRHVDSRVPPPECYYQVTENEEIWVHTCHFSVYFCTYCKKETSMNLTAMVFCGHTATPGLDSHSEAEVRVSMVVVDNRHKIVDILEDIKVEEWERGLRFVDNKPLRLFSHLTGSDQLAFQCTGLDPIKWKHKTRSDNRPIFDEKQVYEMAEVVACCQDCERHRVEWVLAPDPASHPSLPSPLVFSGVVDVLNIFAGQKSSGEEDKKTTFLLSSIQLADARESLQGSKRRREDRFSKARRVLERRLTDQQTLELARGLELAKKDINNVCRGYQGQRLRVRLLEMSYDHMHAQTFWSRLPGLLKTIGAEDALRDLQNQRLLQGCGSPETGEQPSPGNDRDSEMQPKMFLVSENTQPKLLGDVLVHNPGVAQPGKLYSIGMGQQQQQQQQDKNNARRDREALRPDPITDNQQGPDLSRSLLHASHGQTVPKTPQQPHEARGQVRDDETQQKTRPAPGPAERNHRLPYGRHGRVSSLKEKGDLPKPEESDSTEKKEMFGARLGRRERETPVRAAAPRTGHRQQDEEEADDDSGETTYQKTLV